MRGKERIRIHFLYIIMDVMCLAVSFYLCHLLKYNEAVLILTAQWHNLNFFYLSEYTAIFILWCSLSLFALNKFNLFITDRAISIAKETWLTFKALAMAGIPAAAAIFMLKQKVYSRAAFISSWLCAFVLLCLWRAGKRIYIRYRLRKGIGLVRVLIAGVNPITEVILKEIKNHPYLGFEVTGILSQEKAAFPAVFSNAVKILGSYEDAEQVIQKNYIDEILISTHHPRNEIEKLILIGRKMNCGVKIVSEEFDNIYSNFKAYNLGYMQFLEYGHKALHGTDFFLKRLFDIFGAYLLLCLLSPLFILSAVLIRVKDGAPVFYISNRVGRKGKVFNFYKFRSMAANADTIKGSLKEYNEAKAPIFKIKKDPRITDIGRLIRRYSIDELPQLFNVLKGEMSLIGPRPQIPEEASKYDLWQMRKLEVKPGIACLSQVRGRSDISFYKWIKWDLWYIDNWSLWLDAKIFFWTIIEVLKKKGAY